MRLFIGWPLVSAFVLFTAINKSVNKMTSPWQRSMLICCLPSVLASSSLSWQCWICPHLKRLLITKNNLNGNSSKRVFGAENEQKGMFEVSLQTRQKHNRCGHSVETSPSALGKEVEEKLKPRTKIVFLSKDFSRKSSVPMYHRKPEWSYFCISIHGTRSRLQNQGGARLRGSNETKVWLVTADVASLLACGTVQECGNARYKLCCNSWLSATFLHP